MAKSDPPTYYRIDRVTEKQFNCVKLDEDFMPDGTQYTVMLNANKFKACTCPAGQYRGSCKHVGIVKGYVARGQPQHERWNGKTNEWFDLNANVDRTLMDANLEELVKGEGDKDDQGKGEGQNEPT